MKVESARSVGRANASGGTVCTDCFTRGDGSRATFSKRDRDDVRICHQLFFFCEQLEIVFGLRFARDHACVYEFPRPSTTLCQIKGCARLCRARVSASGTVEQWNSGTVEQWNSGTVEHKSH